eukprot:TRINITY_DN10954_c0_g1_i3.p1 TRINITY_DN10954_c0_g1~~TRINITY_DN10954_c0_g1_i3.p1  ORF type:complete len:659 (+),score=124.62 TRINITY_DN10954_c0_g1_i3:136-1977(+)
MCVGSSAASAAVKKGAGRRPRSVRPPGAAASVLLFAALLGSFGSASRYVTELDARQVAGTLYGNRYRAVQVLRGHVADEGASKPAGMLPMPPIVRKDFKAVRPVLAGAFGEVWEAVDEKHNRTVALKLFFKQLPNQQRTHLTWALALNNEDARRAIKVAREECWVARELEKTRYRDEKGASRLMRCLEDHVKGPISLTGHQIALEDPVFQVFEFCGKQNLEQWAKANLERGTADPDWYVAKVLAIFQQVIEGLRYMSIGGESGFVHHDLKPANIIVNGGIDGDVQVKLVDFGGTAAATPKNAEGHLAMSLAYAPPEGMSFKELFAGTSDTVAKGFDIRRPDSFDVYSAGVLLDEMMTGTAIATKVLHAVNFTESRFEERAVAVWRGYKMKGNDAPLSLFKEDWKTFVIFDYVKETCGLEHRFTWRGEGNTDYDDFWRLYQAADVTKEAHRPIYAEYKRRMDHRKEWSSIIARMVSFDPTQRPSPEEVLEALVPMRPGVLWPAADAALLTGEVADIDAKADNKTKPSHGITFDTPQQAIIPVYAAKSSLPAKPGHREKAKDAADDRDRGDPRCLSTSLSAAKESKKSAAATTKGRSGASHILALMACACAMGSL